MVALKRSAQGGWDPRISGAPPFLCQSNSIAKILTQLAKKMLLWEKQENSLIDGNKWAFKLGPIKVEVAGLYLKDSNRTDPQLLSSCSSNGKNQVSSPPLPALGFLQLPSVCQS